MKVGLVFPVESLRGRGDSGNDMIFRQVRGLQIAQPWNSHKILATAPQITVRSVHSQILAAWTVLSSVNVALWNDWAAQRNATNSDGTTKRTGQEWFVSIATARKLNSFAIPTVPPVVRPTAVWTDITLVRQNISLNSYTVRASWTGNTPNTHVARFQLGKQRTYADRAFSEDDLQSVCPYNLGGDIGNSNSTSNADWTRNKSFAAVQWTPGKFVWVKVRAYSSDWWPGVTFSKLVTITSQA